jgi:hypothetical protein
LSSNFSYNTASGTDGGGLQVSFGVPFVTLTDSRFEHNTAKGCGGGLATTSAQGYQISSMTLGANAFQYNTAAYGGGACVRSIYSLSMTSQKISHNTASVAGGALYIAECAPAVVDILSLDTSVRYGDTHVHAHLADVQRP